MTKFAPAFIGMIFLGVVSAMLLERPETDLIAELIEQTIHTQPSGWHV